MIHSARFLPLTYFNLTKFIWAKLTPANRHVNESPDISPVESFNDQHVKVESFDEHPEERSDVEIMEKQRQNGAHRHVLLKRILKTN